MKTWKRAGAFSLVLLIALGLLAGCNQSETTGDSGLLTVMVRSKNDAFAELPAVKNFAAKYDGELKWMNMQSDEQVNLTFASDDEGGVILTSILSDALVSQYSASGMFLPLDEYINEDIMPNLCKMFEKHPSAKAVATMPDGHIYALPNYIGIQSQFLESIIYINKVWLDKLNLEIPTTTDELYEVLKAFKTMDPNGNGEADEIPISFITNDAYSMPEALLSCWGLSTKPGKFDSYLDVENGEVKFTPIEDAWKEMIKYYNKLYTEGLLDQEALTHVGSVFQSKLDAPTSLIGVVWSISNPMANADEYVAIPPIHAPGYEVKWHVNPGGLGLKNRAAITRKCTDVEGALRWLDTCYDEKNTIENFYGAVGDTLRLEDGMYKFNEPEGGKELSIWCTERTLNSTGLPGVIEDESIGTLLEASSIFTAKKDAYEMYAPYVDDEIWTRPYYSNEQIERIGTLQTDIFNIVGQNMAAWISGKSDVTADWDAYVQSLYNVGLEEYLQITQEAYNTYKEVMNQTK